MKKLERQRRKATFSFAVSKTMSKNYRLIEIYPSEPLKETNSNKYNSWAYAIKKKFEIDKSFYPNNKLKVRYALSQMKDSIFDVMHFWVFDIEENLKLNFFFKKIENYMGIHHQKKDVIKTFHRQDEQNQKCFEIWS